MACLVKRKLISVFPNRGNFSTAFLIGQRVSFALLRGNYKSFFMLFLKVVILRHLTNNIKLSECFCCEAALHCIAVETCSKRTNKMQTKES